jgi:hypothetical protein
VPKSIKLFWNEKKFNNGDTLGVLFGERKETIKTAKLMIAKMKETNTLSMTRRQMRLFAGDLQAGTLGVRYSYHNFYTKLLRKLLNMGFIEKDVLIWDPKKRKTTTVYQLRIQPITERPPQAGFVKQTWQVAKGWNDLVQKN